MMTAPDDGTLHGGPWPVDALASELAGLREQGLRVVFTNGCFDLLHPGHVDLLERAAAAGDCLVVAVNDDDSVRRLKGTERPILPLAERLEILAAIRWVDYTVSFCEDTPLELICQLRPDVLVKGADWPEADIVGAVEVRSWGGEVVSVPLVKGLSTTRLVERIRSLAMPGED